MKVDNLIKKFILRVGKKNICMWFAFFVYAIISNFALITYLVPNADGIISFNYSETFGWDIATGRWATFLVYGLRGGMTLPLFTSLICFAIFASCALMIVNLLRIKTTTFSILAGIIFVSFPSITQYLTYFYMSDTLAYSFLLSILALAIKEKKYIKNTIIRYIVVVCLMVFSISLYQAMIGLAICLYFAVVLVKSVKDNRNVKILFFDAVTFGVTCVAALIIYFISVHAACFVTGNPLADYRGINDAANVTVTSIVNAIPNLYKTFYRFYFTDQYYAYKLWGVSAVFAILFLIYILTEIIWSISYIKKHRDRNAVLLVGFRILILILYPVISTCIGVIAVNTAIDFKMLPQMILIILMILSRIEKVEIKHSGYVQGFTLLAAIVVLYTNTAICHAIPEAMEWKKNATASLTNRVLSIIDSSEEYEKGMPVAILGSIQDSQWYAINQKYFERASADTSNWGMFWYNGQSGSQRSWAQYLNNFHGIYMNIVDDATATNIMQTDEFKDMPSIPQENATQVIDGVFVVKISDINS